MEDFFGVLKNDRDKKSIVKNISSLPSNYVGSKRRLLRYIWDIIDNENIEFDSAFDAFSGSGMVSLMFKAMGKKVICNDLLTSSAITSVCLLENNSIPLTREELHFLCSNRPDDCRSFVADNYKDKFFTENECVFLDNYRRNVEILCGDKFYCGIDLINKATLASIPNSNFSVYGKDLKKTRSTHDVNKSYWTEKWRDTTRKRRDENNEIMFPAAINEMCNKYKGAFSLMAIESHVSQHCILGGFQYDQQLIAESKFRLEHKKNKGKEISEIKFKLKEFDNVVSNGDSLVFNSDIITLLESEVVNADLIYLDPPYGGASSDYSTLYRFLEEFLYEDKLENLEHIINGAKRFSSKNGYQEQLENLLGLCSNFKTWIISYNDSSYADLETIKSTIRNAGRTDIKVVEVPITYQFRKGKNKVDADHFYSNYYDDGHKYTERGVEYLIIVK
jgi:adenine-specific DNA-methyltransferase